MDAGDRPARPHRAHGADPHRRLALVAEPRRSRASLPAASIDTGGSGLDHYRFETSTDGGSTWTAPATGGAGRRHGPGRDARPVRRRRRRRQRVGVGAGHGPPRHGAPDRPGRERRLERVEERRVGDGLGVRGDRSPGSGIAGYEYETSTDGGANWSAPGCRRLARGHRRGRDAGSLPRRRHRRLPVRVEAGHRAHRPHRADRAVGRGRLGELAVRGPDHDHGEWLDRHAGVRGRELPVPHVDRRRRVLVGRDGGRLGRRTANGETLVQFRAVDVSGLRSAWAPAAGTAAATARVDRADPTAPSVTGGSNAWKSVAQTTVTASGSTDALSGLAGYEYRESTDGGTTWGSAAAGASDVVSAEGETLVQFRSVDVAGNTSAWTPAAPAGASTVRLDRTDPSDPGVAGGSLAWQSVASVAVTRVRVDGLRRLGAGHLRASHLDRRRRDLVGRERRCGRHGLGAGRDPRPAAGRRRRRATPRRGSGPPSASTARAPSAPSVVGGSSSWQASAPVAVSASGSTDSGGSGLAQYEYRTSLNGGAWSGATAGASVNVAAEGTTQVQFRSVDGAGNASAWTPVAPTAGSTVKLDLTLAHQPHGGGRLGALAERRLGDRHARRGRPTPRAAWPGTSTSSRRTAARPGRRFRRPAPP